MAMSVTLQLTKPITAHGKEIFEITLREPNTEDVREFGSPFLVVPYDTDNMAIEIRASIVAKFIMRLAGIPLSSVDKLCIKDFFNCQKVVLGFFGEVDGLMERKDSQNEFST